MTSKKTVNNADLLAAIQRLETKFDKKFEDIAPYINTLEDIKSAGKIASYVIGVFMTVGGAWVLAKKLFGF